MGRPDAYVAEQVVAEAVPEYELDQRWEQRLPELERFHQLVERRYVRRLLDKHNWNVSASAREAGIARQSLHKLLGRHRIKRPKLVVDQAKVV
jgi:transcriptional regulator of acetoin/glycerol metabolism